MKLWLLKPATRGDERWGYDCAYGFVVRAETELDARELAAEEHGDEGVKSWIRPEDTTCEELLPEGSAQVVLRDFHAG